MKKIMSRWIPFITFEQPLEYAYIEQLFIKVHDQEVQHYSYWSSSASIKKVISYYWYHSVLHHFLFLFSAASLFSYLLAACRNDYSSQHLLIYFIVGLIIFPTLLLCCYFPFYYSEFLPKLQTIAAIYEGKYFEQLQKCKQAQYSNLALMLLFYVWNKTSNLNALSSSDHLSKLLMKVYGVDNGSIKNNLELILNKHTSLSSRKIKEVEKGFEEAYSFFESLGYEKGVSLLKALELKIKNR